MTAKVKGKLGRPVLDPQDKRGITVRVRVTPAERDKLTKLAKGHENVSDYVREKALTP